VCPHSESNGDLFLRTELFYPLNYEGLGLYYQKKKRFEIMLEQLEFFSKDDSKPKKLDYLTLEKQIDFSDSVDSAVLNDALTKNIITVQEYGFLANKLLVRNEIIQSELVGITNKSIERADTDTLTGISNRRGLDKYLLNVVKRLTESNHNRESDPDYILYFLIDVDDFKIVNDTFGHTSGDRALQIISKLLEKEAERGGLVARAGGDEFVFVKEGHGLISQKTANEICERIQAAINKNLSLVSGDINFPLSVSMGCSILIKNDNDASNKTTEEIVNILTNASDEAMYLNKKEKHNR